MRKLLILTLIGFAAQLIDGSLGMAYGVTSASLLLMFGIAPAIASASVHFAEVVTTAASGISHFRFGNVDKEIVWKLTVPGSVGAFAGACFLSRLPGELVKPYVSAFLFLLGVYVFVRFLFHVKPKQTTDGGKKGFLTPLGLIAGFLDATGGGGWGPLATPMLLARDGLKVRKVIGSVDTSEFAIAVSATAGFLISLGWSQVNWLWVGALMIGGVFAAPLAAWIVRVIPQNLLGILVGGLILVTNAKVIMSVLGWSDFWQMAIYIVLFSIWVTSFLYAVWRNRKPSSIMADHQEQVEHDESFQ
ncbi:sulfite exporter TauE/SafE family protein [Paenactinomyces guangxiensis]|uniref:Probable membrane transporter protein n=1 Tax=Paenactinomyces guangxiensis TaxID=1490290 RepID=A0A7W1WT16_9BACL|nr:sulfite exporter TauE/SafE family protein [Paenactinomyces guangxiensis]MBA4495517.1 sulfite exporter TauE/SafE family protein [Paenactinomyces guangxiensis]MBH8592775.1 sulfite exporter TauE/SafE family protein [Paenactinomyces guangxiensis]